VTVPSKLAPITILVVMASRVCQSPWHPWGAGGSLSRSDSGWYSTVVFRLYVLVPLKSRRREYDPTVDADNHCSLFCLLKKKASPRVMDPRFQRGRLLRNWPRQKTGRHLQCTASCRTETSYAVCPFMPTKSVRSFLLGCFPSFSFTIAGQSNTAISMYYEHASG